MTRFFVTSNVWPEIRTFDRKFQLPWNYSWFKQSFGSISTSKWMKRASTQQGPYETSPGSLNWECFRYCSTPRHVKRGFHGASEALGCKQRCTRPKEKPPQVPLGPKLANMAAIWSQDCLQKVGEEKQGIGKIGGDPELTFFDGILDRRDIGKNPGSRHFRPNVRISAKR